MLQRRVTAGVTYEWAAKRRRAVEHPELAGGGASPVIAHHLDIGTSGAHRILVAGAASAIPVDVVLVLRARQAGAILQPLEAGRAVHNADTQLQCCGQATQLRCRQDLQRATGPGGSVQLEPRQRHHA